MVKKCPPGVFCIENYTLSILIFIILGFLLYIWKFNNGNNGNNGNNDNNGNNGNMSISTLSNKLDNLTSRLFTTNNIHTRPDSIFTTNNSVLLNPYMPPNRDDRPIVSNNNNLNGLGIPINIRTQGIESDYRQVGILTRINGDETILPLMGRPLIIGRDTWNFYTITDKNNMIKLPITFKNKNCSSQCGCDNVSNGDTVYVEGYNSAFRVTLYENNTMRYIPYI